MPSFRKGTWWATMSRPRRSFVLKIVKVGPRERGPEVPKTPYYCSTGAASAYVCPVII